jgi:hypothetical protein
LGVSGLMGIGCLVVSTVCAGRTGAGRIAVHPSIHTSTRRSQATYKGGVHGLGEGAPGPEEPPHLAQSVADGAAEVGAEGDLCGWVDG